MSKARIRGLNPTRSCTAPSAQIDINEVLGGMPISTAFSTSSHRFGPMNTVMTTITTTIMDMITAMTIIITATVSSTITTRRCSRFQPKTDKALNPQFFHGFRISS